jgi:hypothetical protein
MGTIMKNAHAYRSVQVSGEVEERCAASFHLANRESTESRETNPRHSADAESGPHPESGETGLT